MKKYHQNQQWINARSNADIAVRLASIYKCMYIYIYSTVIDGNNADGSTIEMALTATQ